MLHPPSPPSSHLRASTKRKLSLSHSPESSSSALDTLLKRQRLERDYHYHHPSHDDQRDLSHSPSPYPPQSRASLSDPDYSDEDEAGPSTPAACLDDNLMDWTADSDLQHNQVCQRRENLAQPPTPRREPAAVLIRHSARNAS